MYSRSMVPDCLTSCNIIFCHVSLYKISKCRGSALRHRGSKFEKKHKIIRYESLINWCNILKLLAYLFKLLEPFSDYYALSVWLLENL